MRTGVYGSSSVAVLVVAMSVVATVFLSTIVFFELSTVRVQHETDGMLSNGVPSIEHVTDARTALRALDGTMDRALLDVMEKRPLDADQLAAARKGLADDIAEYRSLPYYEDEQALNRQLDLQLRRLDDVQQRLTVLLTNGKLQAAHELENGEWRRRSDAVDAQLRAISMFNLRHVTRHAGQIDSIRGRSALVGVAVGAGALALAFAATIIAARAVRKQTLLQEDRARELEMFSSRVAHDLMSPLQPVGMALEVAAEQVRDPTASRLVTRAAASLKRVRLIVDGLLDFARAGGKTPATARASVAKVLGDVVEDTRTNAEKAGIELRLEQAPPVDVACSPGVLTVLVSNLVNNAIKYMGDSKTRVIRLRSRATQRGVCIEVEDTGPGVTAGLGAKIFEPYVRGHQNGSGLGLGLATVKRFVDAHGGHCGVRSPEGPGAIFWFELPKAA